MAWIEGRFLLAAATLHLGLPVAAAVAPEPSYGRLLSLGAVPASLEIAVDIAMLPTEMRLPLETERLPVGVPRPDMPTASDTPPSRGTAPPPDPTSQPDAEPPDPAPGEPSPPMSVGAEPGPGDDINRPPSEADLGGAGIPGMGGTPIWKFPGVVPSTPSRGSAAPTQAPKRQFDEGQAERAVESGVRARDAKLGLDLPAASAVASALRDALRGSDAPFDCSGSFSVTLGPQGNVAAVTLLGFTGGDAATWQAVRGAAAARLGGKVFPMKSSFAKGAVISVSLRSETKMAGGGTARNGATLSFDVTDAVARPTRVVSTGFSASPIR